jgi:hypothetical protein
MNLYLQNERGWPMHSHHVRRLLGVDRLPENGMLRRELQGIIVWVEPLRGERPASGKRHTHRVLAECPVCSMVMSVGRLPQHAKVHQR